MTRQIYVNLPVKDLNKTMDFFSKLGFKFKPEFTDKNAACLIIDENIYVMLLLEPFFKSFTKSEICDTSKYNELIMAISTESREKVDEMVKIAFSAGAKSYNEPSDYGWMYSASFRDLDGHLWEVLYADESKREKG